MKVDKAIMRLFETIGSVVYTKRKKYYYFPFWIEEEEGKTAKLLSFDQLPAEVKQVVMEERESQKRMNEEQKAEYPETGTYPGPTNL